jgi:hypothetical protein
MYNLQATNKLHDRGTHFATLPTNDRKDACDLVGTPQNAVEQAGAAVEREAQGLLVLHRHHCAHCARQRELGTNKPVKAIFNLGEYS